MKKISAVDLSWKILDKLNAQSCEYYLDKDGIVYLWANCECLKSDCEYCRDGEKRIVGEIHFEDNKVWRE